MSKFIDLTGSQFGRWTVVRRVANYGTNARWLCRCECGNTDTVTGSTLRRGESLSCGCLRVELSRLAATKHGKSHTRTFHSYKGMIQRCNNPNNPAFVNYGGRGIKVHPDWMSFETFLSDMGECPEGKSIDRIDNSGNYEPGNCRWASPIQQANNRRPRRWKKRPTEEA